MTNGSAIGARKPRNWKSGTGSALAIVMCTAVACSTPPSGRRAAVTPILPSSQQQIGLDDVLLVLDGSGSMISRSDLTEERGLLESLASAMPVGA